VIIISKLYPSKYHQIHCLQVQLGGEFAIKSKTERVIESITTLNYRTRECVSRNLKSDYWIQITDYWLLVTGVPGLIKAPPSSCVTATNSPGPWSWQRIFSLCSHWPAGLRLARYPPLHHLQQSAATRAIIKTLKPQLMRRRRNVLCKRSLTVWQWLMDARCMIAPRADRTHLALQ